MEKHGCQVLSEHMFERPQKSFAWNSFLSDCLAQAFMWLLYTMLLAHILTDSNNVSPLGNEYK